MNNPIAYVSVLRLNRTDIKVLQIRDVYSLHRVVYGLFSKTSQLDQANRILWVDKGGDFNGRQILILSDRQPHLTPQFGRVETKAISPEFVNFDRYAFEIVINPVKKINATGKIEAIIGREAITQWLLDRAPTWGFEIQAKSLEVQINQTQSFQKGEQKILHNKALIKGELQVTNREQFLHSFTRGVGKGKAFGFGLLQIVPLSN
ncbi:MAG: hypothetical protein RLZZ293_27 [Pseudomonadota bacterium]|jgi:CRISPR system Cascade subunit CasE